ncbi:MAG: DUF2752 domain-containing protein [Clostridia bacterium]|nr:DUF2752 domain-containing protein [Clostridia bacterium]
MTTNSNPEFKKRLRATVIKYSVILCVAAAYLVFVLCTGMGIPCLFHESTGLKCPGCGISRMLASLVRFDVVSAFWYNPFLFTTGPLIIAYLACCEVKYVRFGDRQMGKWEIIMWVELALAIAYGILRNVFPI